MIDVLDEGLIVELFGGPGGWAEALRMLGLNHRSVGIELDRTACRTRAAAGHRTICADVTTYPMAPFIGRTWGFIASPPCQDFSAAGKRAGRTGSKGQLIDLVPAWAMSLQPEWIALEQTPLVIDIWHEFAATFRAWGYRTWVGILNAADYGVPQTRERAILLASRHPIAALEPTHAEHPHPTLFGESLAPWITMAEAVGWGLSDRPAYTFCGSNEGGMDIAGGSGARAAIKRARAEGRWVVDRRTNSKDGRGGMVPTVTVSTDRPAPTLTGKGMAQWLIYHEDEPDRWLKMTVEDALVIQSFRPDYPVQGTKSKVAEQIGNAIPPLLARATLAAVTRIGAEALADSA